VSEIPDEIHGPLPLSRASDEALRPTPLPVRPPARGQQLKSLLLGGILPVIIFTVIEEYFGTMWGLVAGMVFGAGEILWEWKTVGKVDPLTWGGNGMLLVLGGVSLVSNEGYWFKLQPAILEFVMTGALWGSVILGKPLLLGLAQKQGGLPADLESGLKPGAGKVLKAGFRGLTLRLGVFFALHAVLATWAALHWSTAAWAALKGIGLTLSLIVYLVVETLLLRYRISTIHE
jgi:intracellular septation protein